MSVSPCQCERVHVLAALLSTTPSPVPTIPVEVVGDEFENGVALVAAVIAAVAAFVTWRAAVAASAAAKEAEKATETAKEAAQTARDAYREEAADRRSRQARGVYSEWRGEAGTWSDGSGASEVDYLIRNDSDAAIFHVQWIGVLFDVPWTDGVYLSSLASGASHESAVPALKAVPEGHPPGEGILTFIDANGVRWQRWTGKGPVEMPEDESYGAPH